MVDTMTGATNQAGEVDVQALIDGFRPQMDDCENALRPGLTWLEGWYDVQGFAAALASQTSTAKRVVILGCSECQRSTPGRCEFCGVTPKPAAAETGFQVQDHQEIPVSDEARSWIAEPRDTQPAKSQEGPGVAYFDDSELYAAPATTTMAPTSVLLPPPAATGYGMIPVGEGNVVLEARIRFRSEFAPPYNVLEHILFRYNEGTWSTRNLVDVLTESDDPGAHVTVGVVSIDGKDSTPPTLSEDLASLIDSIQWTADDDNGRCGMTLEDEHVKLLADYLTALGHIVKA